ncbi:MAG: hypothetical protein EOO08_04940 [Chitinophagaceae bacterium]|nr:MAG: hypothetical protein EOO08_04940 [Chitinophagaceae bacterium]
MRKLLLFLLLFGCTLLSAAQPRYSIAHYTNKDGLPANGVTGLEWDESTGLMWIGTEGGLVRWDGNNFEARTETEGRVLRLGVVDKRKGIHYAYCDDQSLYEMQQGQIRKRGMYKDFAPSDTTLRAFLVACHAALTQPVMPGWLQPLPGTDHDFLTCRNGMLYDRRGGDARLLRTGVQLPAFFDLGNEAYLIDRQGLWRYDARARRMQRLCTPGWNPLKVRFLRNAERAAPMFYAGRKLFRLLPANNSGECRLETIFDAMPSDLYPRFVRELPAQGTIVLGDGINGIFVLRRNSVRQLTDSSGRISSAQLVTYGQALLPDGNIMGHSGVVYDRKGPIPGRSLPVQGTLHLVPFGHHIYFPIGNFLFRYNLITQTSEQFDSLDGSGYPLLAQTKGQLYLLGGRYFARLEHDRMSVFYTLPLSENGGEPMRNTSATEWAPGVFALGDGNRIRFFDVATKQSRLLTVSNKAAVRFMWRSGQNLYICTYGEGLFLLRNDSVLALPRDKSNYLRFAHAIVPDGHGFCYISTNNGLFKVSEKALERSAGTGSPVCYYFLGREDGLEQTELNGGCTPAYLRLPDGTLSFPTIRGLAQLHPDSVRIAAPPGIILVRARADGRELLQTTNRLDPQTRLFQFDITIPSWSAPQNLYGWYRLRRTGEAASESSWIEFDPTRQRLFNFSALKPDAYDFEVRTFNGFQPGNFAHRSFHFEIAPPWYAAQRAIVLWLLLASLLVWAFVFLRTRQLRRRSLQLEATVELRTREIENQKGQLRHQLQLVSEAHDLKERLISVISHNIITPLRYIHRATTMMRDDARSLDPVLREKAVDSINDTSLELELLSINLLNWIKLQHRQMHVVPEHFSFAEVSDHVRSLLGPVARSKGQEIKVAGPADTQVYQYKDAVQVIMYNLVLNAIAHSGGTTTTLAVRRDGDAFVLSVRDDGTGMPEALQMKLLGDEAPRNALKETDNQGKGFGFIIIRDLVHFIGGQLRVENAKPGTIISVRFRAQPL